jgi:hypothetical protein
MAFRLKNATRKSLGFLKGVGKRSVGLVKGVGRGSLRVVKGVGKGSLGLLKKFGNIKLRGRSLTRRAGNVYKGLSGLAGMTGKRIMNSLKYVRKLTRRR